MDTINASGFAVLINSISDSAGVDGERLNVVNPFETKNESSTLHPKLWSSPTGVVNRIFPLSFLAFLFSPAITLIPMK